jgi:flagellar export protein FliJ
MKSRNTIIGTKLESLEKWRTSELDQAQIQHAQKRTAAARNEEAVESVRQVIDGSQNLAREQLAGNCILSVDSLTRLRHFTALKLDELQQAQSTLADSQREVADAKAVILEKFESLTVLERLRKRRTAQASKDDLRREQRQMDDQALLRTPESGT